MLKNNFIKYSLMFILLILFQILVLNRISFLGFAIPYFYIYFIIKLPIGFNRSLIVLLGFILGIIIDLFFNTPGINAAATTLAAFLCRPIQGLFFVADDYKEMEPRLSLLGANFMKYATIIVLIHNIALVSIESFSYFNMTTVIYRIVLSTLLTSLLILAFEGFSIKKTKKTWE